MDWGRRLSFVAAGIVAVVVIGVVLLGRAPERAEPSHSPSVAATSPTPSATPTTVPTSPTPTTPTPFSSPAEAGTFENRVLGYRITMPDGFRRSLGRVFTGQELLGDDQFTTQTEAEAREECMQDAGHIPVVREPPDIGVTVYRDPGLTADAWAKTPRAPGAQPRSHHHNVEAFTVGGYDAVKLVQDNASAATSAVIIRANDRVYEIGYSGAWSPWSASMATYLDDIAKTFTAVQPTAFPNPTPTRAPEPAAREVASALARAFAARNADGVRSLMPDCWIGVVYAVDGVVPGQGGSNRSVHLFTEALRERFAADALTVTVDPTLRTVTDASGVWYYLRSDWREPDRAIRIDLELRENSGRWLWRSAVHHFASGECILYRSPWTSTPGRC